MRERLLELLASPCCRGELAMASGELVCSLCGLRFPVEDGVPRLFVPPELGPEMVRTRESFAWEWDRYPGPMSEDEGIFLEETQIPKTEFAGKTVLDAGCGMGRYSRVALSLGAEVVAFDLSDAALRLAREMGDHPKLHVVQGNLLHPPFKKGVFDIAYSQGVLHHTPDTELALRHVARLVRSRGLISVWVYGKAGKFKDFATNPVRPDRKWIERNRRLAWMIVASRHCVSDLMRVLTVRMPMAVTYALCYPIAAFGALPGVKYLTFSVHPDFRVRLIENFDWLSPPYQFHHTKEELSAWCQDEGFTVLKVLPHGLIPKPGVLARRTD